MRKLNVAVLAGGRSSEHDISRLSALGVMDALDADKYHAVPILIGTVAVLMGVGIQGGVL